MDNDIVIAVVCGGTSAEAEVSRVSGRGVAEALQKNFRNVHVLDLDSRIGAALRDAGTDVVFPVLHGPMGEDGTFQGFLEVLGLPYVGSGVGASACAMNKAAARGIFAAAGLPVSAGAIVNRNTDARAAAARIVGSVGDDVVVKPCSQGSALGVSFCVGIDEISGGIARALEFDEWVLAEKRVSGREITVGIIEREEAEALPVIEIETPEATWYDFEHRYTPGLSRHIIPAPLSEEQYARTQEIALGAHRALGCRDLSRADFVVPEEGEPVILEVNTIPGMTPTSLYPDAAAAVGMSFEQLVEHLVRRAAARGVTEEAAP